MPQNEVDTFCPASRQQWQQWLQSNHATQSSIWLVYYKKQSGVTSILYQEAVEEALCFGWIDSVKKSLDESRYVQFFCKRKPHSGWSKINKEKVKRLIAEGLMMSAGYASIETARQNNSWTLL